MTNINISKIADIVTDSCAVVVVSAVGAISVNDCKVTDMLVALHSSLPNCDLWDNVASKYRRIVAQHHIDIDIDTLLDDTINNILHYNNYHYTVSVGEQLSAVILSKYLGRQYLEAEDIVIFDNNGVLDYNSTISSIAKVVQPNMLYVMGGFYGATYSGARMTFSRGGSDISGALVAAAIGADIYENWTDVCGLCHADPRQIDCVGSVRCISFSDMQILADCGVGVLNNSSIYPVRASSIPINIRSIYNRFDIGTLVGEVSTNNAILSIIQSTTSTGIYSTTIISTYDSAYIANKVANFAKAVGVELLTIHCNGIVTTVSTNLPIIKALYKHLVD